MVPSVINGNFTRYCADNKLRHIYASHCAAFFTVIPSVVKLRVVILIVVYLSVVVLNVAGHRKLIQKVSFKKFKLGLIL